MNEAQPSARDIAVRALCDRAGNVSAHLERLLGRSALPGTERDLARELALGSLRRRETLRSILDAFLAKPTKKLPGVLEEILLIALYQIVFLQRVPVFAAVNEAVNQAILFRHKRQSGLVNGVLRGVKRALSERLEGQVPLAADIIPVGPNCYRKLKRPVFPDPSSRPAEYLAKAFSLPLSLAERWQERFGSLEEVVSLATHANVRAPLILRVNRLRSSLEEVLASLAAADLEARPHENGCSVVLAERTNVANLEVFRNGWVQVQDPAATLVSQAAAPQAEMSVLDFCAAPGTKTTHLAELMDNRGSITAVDVSSEKIDRIESNCRRLGISIVTTCLAEEVGGLTPASFDLALVDVPCSNTGVLARRAEARWRFDPQKLGALTQDQRLLACTAGQFVRPGGRLIYSTCSIEPEECGEVVQDVVRKVRNLTLVREEMLLPAGAEEPTRWRDGGYLAIFAAR